MASSEEIQVKVKALIAEALGVSEDEIQNSSSFIEDLGADSLDIVELIMAIEKKFNIEIPDQEAEKITSVQHAIDYIAERAG